MGTPARSRLRAVPAAVAVVAAVVVVVEAPPQAASNSDKVTNTAKRFTVIPPLWLLQSTKRADTAKTEPPLSFPLRGKWVRRLCDESDGGVPAASGGSG